MKILNKVIIRDFRSISSADINITEGYLPIVGANNSGKSNVLRALNLFFNDQVEPGILVRMEEDFHNPSRKKKKKISITLEFQLPDNFNFQKTIRTNLEDLLGRHFLIEKVWLIPESPIEKEAKLEIYFSKDRVSMHLANPAEEYRIRQFLALIRFRYVPNHIHPSEILRKEQSSIQTELLAKLRRSKKVTPEVQESIFNELGQLSKDFILPIADEINSAIKDIEGIDLSTPTNMGELLFSFAPRLKVSGGENFKALLHGSGVQSLLTLLILRYLDSRFSSRFGWHQATIWALEEPESFLHKDLEHKVADILSTTGKNDAFRFQVFCTTHSDVFVRYASEGILCVLKDGKTSATPKKARDLAGEASKLGISSYVPPLLYGAPKPLLIVEGPTDKILIEYAYAKLALACPWEIEDIPTITQSYTGVDGLKNYLRTNQEPLKNRALKSPVFVLIDWNETDSKIGDFEGILKIHPTSKVVRWSKDDLNPQLDQTFTGIERYLSTEAIMAAEKKGFLELKKPTNSEYPLSTTKDSIERGKMKIANLIVDRDRIEDLQFFRNQLLILSSLLAENQKKLITQLF